MGEQDVRRVVGAADLCELLAAAFAFPSAELAGALADGDFRADARACLSDAGVGEDEVERVAARLDGMGKAGSADELLALMRKGYSLLYLAPGAKVPVFPYESAFRHQAEGADGSPALFRSPVTQDVERQMRAVGVMPPHARTEPADSVWNEFSFLSFGFGSLAEALYGGDGAREAECRNMVAYFWDEHGSRWLPAFMDATIEQSDCLDEPTWTDPYQCLAVFGRVACRAIAERVAAAED